MGMFFYVDVEPGDKCPYCKAPIYEWQSKDSIGDKHDVRGGCCNGHGPLPRLKKSEVENFYTSCENKKCDAWIEYRNEKGRYVLYPNQ